MAARHQATVPERQTDSDARRGTGQGTGGEALAQAVRIGRATAGRLGEVAGRLPEVLPEVVKKLPGAADLARGAATRIAELTRGLVRRLGLSEFGVSVVGFAAVSGAAGAVMGWRELTLIGFGAVAVVVFAIGYTLAHTDVTVHLVLSNSRLKLSTKKESVQATLTVAVTNNSSSRGLRPLRIEIPCGDRPWSPRTTSLAPGKTWTASRQVPALRRGVITVGPVATVRTDPLGLFRHAAVAFAAQEIIVHPRTVSLDRLGAGLLRDLEGKVTKHLASQDMAFHALRPYVPGDERRHIHWRTSARVDKLMVRQFVDTRSSHLAIVVSGAQSDYANEEEFEEALSVGASLAVRASHDNQTVSVLAAGHSAVTAARQRLLDPFSRADWSRRGPTLATMVGKGARRLSGVSVAVIIAGSVLEPKQLRQAAARFDAHVKFLALRVGADSAKARPRVGDLTLLDVARLEDLPRVLRSVS